MESLKTLEMLGWSQSKIDEFRGRWNSADSALSHHQLCEEYGLGYKLAVNCFGMKVLRSHPIKISRKDWEKLKAEWIDPNGRSTSEIVAAYGISHDRISDYLGSRPIAQLMASEIQLDVDDNSSKYHVLLIKYGLDVDQITSIRTSWQNPECDHGQISEDYGIPLGLLELLFGTGRPRSLSEDQWKELKRRWFDRAGGSLDEICADFNLGARAPLTYLPRIREARKGRKASKLAKILSPEVYEALCEAIETGEFTTYKALSEQYNVSLKSIVIEFGKCGDVKRRVVAPDCPLCLSKSQYVWAKKMWRSPQGFTAEEIAEKVGVLRGTLLKHFGPIKDRDRPKGISETKWKELKKKWCDPKGETRQKIAADFGISYGTLNRYLPPCQSGRRKTQLSMRITPEKLEELRKRIETGNFKSFAALAREYNLSQKTLRNHFGNCRDIKRKRQSTKSEVLCHESSSPSLSQDKLSTPDQRERPPKRAGQKRDHKVKSIPFNQTEWEALEAAAEKSGRTKSNFIRWAIMEEAQKLR
jgi:uncharacterized protein YeaC (DUF1315 family)